MTDDFKEAAGKVLGKVLVVSMYLAVGYGIFAFVSAEPDIWTWSAAQRGGMLIPAALRIVYLLIPAPTAVWSRAQ